MLLYHWIKFIHIVSSTILFGTGIGTACTLLYAHYTRNIQVIAAMSRYVVLVDWIFTGSSGFLQPVTGFWLVYITGYPFHSLWIIGSIIGYSIAAACWFPVVYLQIQIRNLAENSLKNSSSLPAIYYRYFKYWFYLGWPAFTSLLIVFYLMTNKPL